MTVSSTAEAGVKDRLQTVAKIRKLKKLQAAVRSKEYERQRADIELTLQERYKWRQDPVGWAKHALGEFMWSKQREIMHSLRDNRYTAVRSCHGVGKSFSAARAVCWWLESHPPGKAFVVTSAPTGAQVRAILWREIGKAYSESQVRHKSGIIERPMAGRLTQTEWLLPSEGGKEELVAFGRKPADYNPDAFQGIHARYVLVVLDEACGIPQVLWDAARTLATNEDCRILAIGNPDDPVTEFKRVCDPGSGWNVIRISAFDSPNLTGELDEAVAEGRLTEEEAEELSMMLVSKQWVEEMRVSWGEDSPLWQSKVLGNFPENSENTLIPLSWLERARQFRYDERNTDPRGVGVDVARFGGDKSAIYKRYGNKFRLWKTFSKQDTMETAGRVIQVMREYDFDFANIDEIGVGAGVVDRLQEQGINAYGINVAGKPHDSKRFVNIRAELYWTLREIAEDGMLDLDPDDDEVLGQLAQIRYKITSSGKIQIESKADMAKRGVPSPDLADALVLSLARRKKRRKIRVSGVR